MGAVRFDKLTPAGQVRRLRHLVPPALAHHDIAVARIRLAAAAFNTTFRIDTVDGRRLALRVGARWHLNTDDIAEVEATWAAALARDTPLRPPQVVRSRDGAAAVRVGADGVTGVRECVLFSWQPGRPLRGRLDDRGLVVAAGEVLALLHTHGASFDGVRPDQVLLADRVCYFRLPDRLTRHGAVFAEAVAWAQQGIDALWRSDGSGAHLLHGDLHPGNLLVDRRRLVPLDFQDAMWGLDAQDVAITRWMLDRDDPGGSATAALRSGYERHRTWPVTDPAVEAHLLLARHLHVANLICNVRPDEQAIPFVDALAGKLRRVMART